MKKNQILNFNAHSKMNEAQVSSEIIQNDYDELVRVLNYASNLAKKIGRDTYDSGDAGASAYSGAEYYEIESLTSEILQNFDSDNQE